MKKDLAKEIQKRNLHCIFISPHQDDVLLSCGALLDQLHGKTTITVVNVFTKAHKKPYTLSAKQFLKYSGYSDAQALYEERQKEDKDALSRFKAKIIDLDMEDALFRTRKKKTFLGNVVPEFDHIYPTYRWHMLKGVNHDDPAVSLLKQKLQVFKNKKNIIFAPFGIGNHVDHLIVSQVCQDVFDNVVLYSDFPYTVRLHTYGDATSKKNIYNIKPDMKKKVADIIKYKTQFDGLFPSGTVPNHKEVYYAKKEL